MLADALEGRTAGIEAGTQLVDIGLAGGVQLGHARLAIGIGRRTAIGRGLGGDKIKRDRGEQDRRAGKQVKFHSPSGLHPRRPGRSQRLLPL
jgi:hypothetical protein